MANVAFELDSLNVPRRAADEQVGEDSLDAGMRLAASSTRIQPTLSRPVEVADPREILLVHWCVDGHAVKPRSGSHAGGSFSGNRQLRACSGSICTR